MLKEYELEWQYCSSFAYLRLPGGPLALSSVLHRLGPVNNNGSFQYQNNCVLLRVECLVVEASHPPCASSPLPVRKHINTKGNS
jgi:hypothetical protein